MYIGALAGNRLSGEESGRPPGLKGIPEKWGTLFLKKKVGIGGWRPLSALLIQNLGRAKRTRINPLWAKLARDFDIMSEPDRGKDQSMGCLRLPGSWTGDPMASGPMPALWLATPSHGGGERTCSPFRAPEWGCSHKREQGSWSQGL